MHLHRPWRTVAPCAEFPNDNPDLHAGAIWRCSDVNGAASCEPAGDSGASPPSDAVEALAHEPTPTEPIVVVASEPAHDLVAVGGAPERFDEAADSEDEPAGDAADEYAIDIVDDLGFGDDVVEEALQACAADALSQEAKGEAEAEAEEEPEAEADAEARAEAEAEAEAEGGAETEATEPSDDSCARLCSDDPFARLRDVVEDVARALGCAAESVRCLGALLGGARLDASAISAACAEALVAGGQLEEGEHGLRRAEGFAREVLAWQGILRGESDDFGACGRAMLDEWCANLLARAMGSPSRAEPLRRELRRRGVAAFGLIEDAA